MNLVAWAAGAILLIAPENLMSVSFQMSFAAVTALVATYELSYARHLNQSNVSSKIRRAVFYFSAVLLTTLVAGIATAPFVLYHFNQVTLLGVVANLFAVPLTALWVMPWAVVAFLLMPFGLAEFALVPMGWGIDAVIFVEKTAQSLPGSVAYLPAMPAWGFALICLGGLWLCLWRLPWRTVGAVPVVIGFAMIASVQTPDVLVSETGKLTAVKGNNGMLMFQSRARGFVAGTWLRRSDEALSVAGSPISASGTPAIRCDTLGCIVRTRGQIIAFVRHVAALSEDCRVASVLISRILVRKRQCVGPKAVIDRYDLWRNGAHALWLTSEGIEIKTVGGTDGKRPWSRYPRVRSN